MQFILSFVIIIYMNEEFIEKYQELRFHNCCFIEDNVDKNEYIIVYKITTFGTKEIIVGQKVYTIYISTKIIFNREDYMFYRLPGNFYIKFMYFDEYNEPYKEDTFSENPYDLLTDYQINELNIIFDSYINNLNKFSKHLKD